jgi:SnoaL-like domain
VPSDRDAIIETVTKVAWYADRRDWDAITRLFAEKVLLDYTSLTGGEPATVSPQQIADNWEQNLGALDATQHLLGSYLVNQVGHTAEATANFIATHIRHQPSGGGTWTLGGRYHWRLRRDSETWKIEAMTMTAIWSSGDQSIMAPSQD